MREYTIEDFEFESISEKSYGHWEQSWKDPAKGMFAVNYCSILTALIQVAGRICRRYASDLFIDWMSINKKLQDKSYNGGKYLFGFREDGVDHAPYVLSRLNSSGFLYSRSVIKEMYMLEIKVEHNEEYPDDIDIYMYLGKARLMEDAGMLDRRAA